MSYSIDKITTVADCDLLLAWAAKEKADLNFKKLSEEKPSSQEMLLVIDRIGREVSKTRLKENIDLALNLGQEITLVKEKETTTYNINPECCGNIYRIL